MKTRICIAFCLLAVLLAARLLDVHFHLPPKASGEGAHVEALALIEAHRHGDEPDHGHIAGHLYEGEADETEGAGLLAKISLAALFVPLLLGLLLLAWRISARSLRLPRVDESPPRRRRWARLAPPSQAPPLPA